MHSIGPLIVCGNLCFSNGLVGISSRIYTRTPPPFRFRSRRYGLENPGIEICPKVNVSSICVSVKNKTSKLDSITYFSSSILPSLASVAIFKFPKISLFTYLSLKSFKNSLGLSNPIHFSKPLVSKPSFMSLEFSEPFCNNFVFIGVQSVFMPITGEVGLYTKFLIGVESSIFIILLIVDFTFDI